MLNEIMLRHMIHIVSALSRSMQPTARVMARNGSTVVGERCTGDESASPEDRAQV